MMEEVPVRRGDSNGWLITSALSAHPYTVSYSRIPFTEPVPTASAEELKNNSGSRHGGFPLCGPLVSTFTLVPPLRSIARKSPRRSCHRGMVSAASEHPLLRRQCEVIGQGMYSPLKLRRSFSIDFIFHAQCE